MKNKIGNSRVESDKLDSAKIVKTNNMNMNKRDLKKLTKSELINMIIKKDEPKKEKKLKKNFEDLFDDDPFPEHLTKTEEEKTIEKYRKRNLKTNNKINKLDRK